jgi:hypothetical protein
VLYRWPLLFLVILLPLRGQDNDGPIQMKPDLALAIPLLQKGHDVLVKFPVLINPTTVVKPGMILRVIYIPPVQSDSENLGLAHKGDMEQSFSRTAPNSDGEKMPAEIAHQIERQRRVVWEVPINFQLALAQLPTDNLHLIYSMSGDNRNLDDERFSFFDGMFLGSPVGGVSVLAVEIGSKAEQAGFKAGDQILVMSGTPVSDLGAFPGLWAAAKEKAKYDNATSFPFVVRSTGESGNHTLNLAMPPTIKSQLMEGF